MTQTALVTGGAGFIGSHLCETLLQDGYRVTCLDNFSSPSKKNIRHLLAHSRFRFVVHDIRKSYTPLGEVDLIINLASPAAPLEVRGNEPVLHEIAFLALPRLLSLASRVNAPLLHLSSIDVYRSLPSTHPHYGYVVSKQQAEAHVLQAVQNGDVDAGILRLPPVYGPRMRKGEGRVIPTFISQALGGKPLTVYGDGQQKRSFCYVTDAVTALTRSMEAGDGEVFELKGIPETNILSLAEQVVALSHSRSKITRVTNPFEEESLSLGTQPGVPLPEWVPSISLPDGLKKTIDYFRSIQ